jgi:DNA repair protein RadC
MGQGLRVGLGKGFGRGYFNIMPNDSYIHSLSAKGIPSKLKKPNSAIITPEAYNAMFKYPHGQEGYAITKINGKGDVNIFVKDSGDPERNKLLLEHEKKELEIWWELVNKHNIDPAIADEIAHNMNPVDIEGVAEYYPLDPLNAKSYNENKDGALLFAKPDFKPNLKLKIKRQKPTWGKNVVIDSPNKVKEVAKEIIESDRENMWALHLDTKNNLVAIEQLSVGTLNSSVIHPREAFKSAILNNSNAIILLHNHPSGDTKPSSEDIEVYRKLKETSETVSIPIKDFVIVGDKTKYSFVEENEL